MAISTVAFDRLKAFEIDANFPAEVTFNHISSVLDGRNNLGDLLFGQFFCADIRINASSFKDGERIDWADTVEIPQRN